MSNETNYALLIAANNGIIGHWLDDAAYCNDCAIDGDAAIYGVPMLGAGIYSCHSCGDKLKAA